MNPCPIEGILVLWESASFHVFRSAEEKGLKITELRKKYPNQWLLIRVTAVDSRDQPIDGVLVAHSKNRDDIYDAQLKLRADLYIAYTGKMPEKGYAVALHA